MLFCDRRRMAEVVQNLLENAINCMGDQAEPKILFGMREEDGVKTFFVQDNGIGIDEKYHRIIEVHGDKVWVESEGEGMGSRFCFTVGS
jgi:light-regulated signal transduction histidine kinase (bacteriophytochrome)